MIMLLVRSLKAIADDNRMKILTLLLSSDLCVGALASHLGISKPAVSQHLRILRKAGLVRGEKRGYWTHYTVERQAIEKIAAELNKLGQTPKTFDTVCWRINEFPPNTIQQKEDEMCQNCCQQPEKLKDKPESCTPEQIKECHGESGGHPCTKENCAPEKE